MKIKVDGICLSLWSGA